MSAMTPSRHHRRPPSPVAPTTVDGAQVDLTQVDLTTVDGTAGTADTAPRALGPPDKEAA